MTEQSDPWKDISPPAQASSVSGRRVDPELQWALYWAIDTDNGCLLILRHKAENRPEGRLPNLQGLEIETRQPQSEDQELLVIRLKDNEQREIFYRLCLDIIEATRPAKSEADAIGRFLARTWRWHWLLRGGKDDKLSDEEQKGLIGELWLLHHHLIPKIGAMGSVQAWAGPLDAPKDFEIGRICIEAKAKRGAATPFITISTEHQLDTSGVDKLFLSVLEVNQSLGNNAKGISVTDMAKNILEDIQEKDAPAVALFEKKLLAYGFDWAHDYSDSKWLLGANTLYEVTEGFPRITPGMYQAGVSKVRYSISLHDCEPFQINDDALVLSLMDATNGN